MSVLDTQQAVDEQFLDLTASLVRRAALRSIVFEVASASIVGVGLAFLATWGVLASISLHMTL